MIAEGVSYEERLRNYQLATELLKRKLRTSYVSQLIKSISLSEIRDMHRAIHQGESPSSGLLPAIEAIPQVRESMLYLSLFASLYRHASQADIKTEMDVPAIMVAWDFFCGTFPNHIRERRPYGKVRPANFSEAWVVAQALKIGLADLHYCRGCHGDTLVIYHSKFPPSCQICVLDSQHKKHSVQDCDLTQKLSLQGLGNRI
jgi:hypothetical protein